LKKNFNFSFNLTKTLLLIYSCLYSNSSELKGKLEIGNNLAAEFNTKFINITELLTNSYKNLWVESDFVKSSAILINLISNSAADLLPISSLPLNSEELLYIVELKKFSGPLKIQKYLH